MKESRLEALGHRAVTDALHHHVPRPESSTFMVNSIQFLMFSSCSLIGQLFSLELLGPKCTANGAGLIIRDMEDLAHGVACVEASGPAPDKLLSLLSWRETAQKTIEND